MRPLQRKETLEYTSEIITKLISKFDSLRAFARSLPEEAADVLNWRDGKRPVNPRAAIQLCRIHGINLHKLRPDIFPEDMIITFKK